MKKRILALGAVALLASAAALAYFFLTEDGWERIAPTHWDVPEDGDEPGGGW